MKKYDVMVGPYDIMPGTIQNDGTIIWWLNKKINTKKPTSVYETLYKGTFEQCIQKLGELTEGK